MSGQPGRHLFKGNFWQVRVRLRVLDCHADEIAGGIKVDVDILRDLSRLGDGCRKKLKQGSIGVLEKISIEEGVMNRLAISQQDDPEILAFLLNVRPVALDSSYAQRLLNT